LRGSGLAGVSAVVREPPTRDAAPTHHRSHDGREQVARREAFVKQRERFLPVDVLQRMGLYSAPPQCDVTVPFCEEGLLRVSDEELAAVYQVHEMTPTHPTDNITVR
jgi:hypothetical protein